MLNISYESRLFIRAVFTWLSKVIEELVWFWFYYALYFGFGFTTVKWKPLYLYKAVITVIAKIDKRWAQTCSQNFCYANWSKRDSPIPKLRNEHFATVLTVCTSKLLFPLNTVSTVLVSVNLQSHPSVFNGYAIENQFRNTVHAKITPILSEILNTSIA